MGYSYTTSGLLCCDICGSSGGVRKYRCPWGWCQPPAACGYCRKKRAELFVRPYHRALGCEKNHKRAVVEQEHRTMLLTNGKAVRCSALNAQDDQVHVLFQLLGNRTVGYYMDKSTYHAIPLLEVATPEDYAKHGEITPAPDTFKYGRVSKQVV